MQTPKGMDDHSPEEQRKRQHVINTIQTVFERYGFHPLETPVMEHWQTLSAKHAGGSEILKETYKLTDQGGRELGLRYDLTVPLARYISQHPTVKQPFKRYHIGPVFRDGPVKQGRKRQFHQADADIIGADTFESDVEILQLALDVFDELGIDIQLQINNRRVLKRMTDYVGISDFETAVLILDKTAKKSREELLAEADEKGIGKQQFADLLELCDSNLHDINTDEINELKHRTNDERLHFNPRLARGLAYYTGTIYEAFTPTYDSSLASGGRYDEMIGKYTDRDNYPAIGVSFGIEPITLQVEHQPQKTQVYIQPINEREHARRLAQKLRKNDINTGFDLTQRNISSGLDYADHYDIPTVIIVGHDEVENGYYTVRDMETGNEQQIPHENILDHF